MKSNDDDHSSNWETDEDDGETEEQGDELDPLGLDDLLEMIDENAIEFHNLLFKAIEKKDLEEVRSLLDDEVNLANLELHYGNQASIGFVETILHVAVMIGTLEVMDAILATKLYPDYHGDERDSPVLRAFVLGRTEIWQRLLLDPRVAPCYYRDKMWESVLYAALVDQEFYQGKGQERLELVRWVFATCPPRDVFFLINWKAWGYEFRGYLGRIPSPSLAGNWTEEEAAVESWVEGTETEQAIARVVFEYKLDPAASHRRLQFELDVSGVRTKSIARLYALSVLLCDDYFTIRVFALLAAAGAARFFLISARMPLELQMTLANRVYSGLVGNSVLGKNFETGCRWCLLGSETN